MDTPPKEEESGGVALMRLANRESKRMQYESGELPDPITRRLQGDAQQRSAAMATPDDRKRVKFDPTIKLGDIITCLGLVGFAFSAYNMMDKRVTVLEVQSSSQKEELRQATQVLREDVKDVRKSIDDLARSIRGIDPRSDRR